MGNYFDIYIVGIGGQGVLTIADILTLTATNKDIEINYYPTKGMAQRGGFVKAQLRIGRQPNKFSPSISEGGSDMIVSMELCETLRTIRYGKEGAKYVVLGNRWLPTEVMLGNAPYPEEELIVSEIKKSGGVPVVLSPELVPEYARPNLFLLGAAYGCSELNVFFSLEEIEDTIKNRWPRVAENNLKAFHAGMKAVNSL